jgi:hypothetical protein
MATSSCIVPENYIPMSDTASAKPPIRHQRVGENCITEGLVTCTFVQVGARGSVVVKALCYKPEGRGFNSR